MSREWLWEWALVFTAAVIVSGILAVALSAAIRGVRVGWQPSPRWPFIRRRPPAVCALCRWRREPEPHEGLIPGRGYRCANPAYARTIPDYITGEVQQRVRYCYEFNGEGECRRFEPGCGAREEGAS